MVEVVIVDVGVGVGVIGVGVEASAVSQTSGPTQGLELGRCHVKIRPGSWAIVIAGLERS